jgi:hypothetical protein
MSRRRGGAEETRVPEATFRSYYGRPVLKAPVWKRADIASYLFLGGLAGGSSLLALGAEIVGLRVLSRRSKVAAAAAISLSTAALVHDLGRPARFANMLRTFKPTSPMNMGSWLLALYGPAAGASAATSLSGRLPRVGAAATGVAGALAPAVAAYTAVLLGDTAVPAWHEGARELPYAFVGSGAMAAGGLGLVAAPVSESGPARRLGTIGAVAEVLAVERMRRRLGVEGEPYRTGRPGRLLEGARALAVAGAVGAQLSRGRRGPGSVAGAAMVLGSALTRFAVFEAGLVSASDPRYVVEPQRRRLEARSGAVPEPGPRPLPDP